MKIAIVGATGLVGRSFLRLLSERNFLVSELKLFASKKNEGKIITFCSQTLTLQCLKPDCFKGLDVVFFSSGDEISREWAGEALRSKALVVDNSASFRMKEDVPLIVPEINASAMKMKKPEAKIVANPNCSTIQLTLALYPIKQAFGLRSVHVSSYQALSGAGGEALNHLKNDSLDLLKNAEHGDFHSEDLSVSQYPHASKNSHAFTCIPQIGSINEEGFSTEELKIMRETKKILELPNLKITATAVRVPVFNSHCEAITFSLEKPTNREKILEALSGQKGLQIVSEPSNLHSRFADGKDDVYVGRIREVPEGQGRDWMMWIVADNLRKGAALNSLQILETLTKN